MAMDDIGVTFRWVDGNDASEQDWARVHAVIEARGWMPLNRATTRILIAEDASGNMVGFLPIQLIPYNGPLWVHPAMLGQGIADELAGQMEHFLLTHDARGWISVCESAHAERICRERGMEKVNDPVYVRIPEGE